MLKSHPLLPSLLHFFLFIDSLPLIFTFLNAFLFLFYYYLTDFWCTESSWLHSSFFRVTVGRGSSRLQCMGSSVQGLLSVHRLQVHELQEMQHSAAVAPGSRAQAQYLWHMGLAALRNLESSQTRDQTCVPCIG